MITILAIFGGACLVITVGLGLVLVVAAIDGLGGQLVRRSLGEPLSESVAPVVPIRQGCRVDDLDGAA